MHDLFHIIPRPPYQPETQSKDDSRDDMENVIFLSYTSDILFYEANKQNEINLFGSLIVYSADTFSKHYCQRRASVPP
jgi:hypothetical protein